MFWNILKLVLKTFQRLETFQSVLEYFKFLLKNISKIIFGTFQKCSGAFKMFLKKCFETFLICLVGCLVFRMFRNFYFIPKHSDLFWEYLKIFWKIFKIVLKIFRFVFGDISKVFWNIKTFSFNLLQEDGGQLGGTILECEPVKFFHINIDLFQNNQIRFAKYFSVRETF